VALEPVAATTHTTDVTATRKPKGLPELSAVTVAAAAAAAALSSGAELDEAPVYFERFSSFFSRHSATDVLLAISTVLESQLIDFAFNSQRNKIRGVCFVNNVSATFCVTVWRHSASGRLLVEFQRRSGCCVAFSAFYRHTVAQLHHIVDQGPTVSGHSHTLVMRSSAITTPLPSPSIMVHGTGLGSVTLDAPTTSVLLSMCEAGADTLAAQEALRVLVSATTENDANRAFLARGEQSTRLLTVLNRVLRGQDSHAALLAAKLLAAIVPALRSTATVSAQALSLTQLSALTPALVNTLLAAVDGIQVAPLPADASDIATAQALLPRETRRQCATILGELAAANPAHVAYFKSQCAASLRQLSRLSATSDLRLRVAINRFIHTCSIVPLSSSSSSGPVPTVIGTVPAATAAASATVAVAGRPHVHL